MEVEKVGQVLHLVQDLVEDVEVQLLLGEGGPPVVDGVLQGLGTVQHDGSPLRELQHHREPPVETSVPQVTDVGRRHPVLQAELPKHEGMTTELSTVEVGFQQDTAPVPLLHTPGSLSRRRTRRQDVP